MIKNLEDQFNEDKQGLRFTDVTRTSGMPWVSTLHFFEHPDRQRRMEESETHHDRPALAGVIREFERMPEIALFFKNNDSHMTVRFRQAVGVLVRVIMESRYWRTTGRKGSLGTRDKVAPRTTTPGAYRNRSGLSIWFTRAERYELAKKIV